MSIRLHQKYGVNPSITTCYVCGEDKNELVLLGAASKRMTGSDEAPRRVCMDRIPCDKCRDFMDEGAVFLIAVKDGQPHDQEPLRTGVIIGLKREAFLRVFTGPESEASVKLGYCFIEESTLRQIIPPESWPTS